MEVAGIVSLVASVATPACILFGGWVAMRAMLGRDRERIDDRIGAVEARLGSMEARLAAVETKVEHVDRCLHRIERQTAERFDRLEALIRDLKP